MPSLLDRLKVPFLVILFFFLCLFIFTKLFGPLELAQITGDNTDVFTVDGTGNATATPKTAMVSVSITKTATDAQTAQQEVNSIADKFTADIKALGIQEKDIKTTNYSSNPVSPSVIPVPLTSNGTAAASGVQSAIIGMPIRPPTDGNAYTVEEDLQINASSVDTANKVIDTATQDGANTIGGVQFTFSDDEQQTLKNQARTEAIQNAKQKAQAIASESGIHLGRLINVQESDNNGPYPLYAAAKSTGNTNQTPTNLQPGQNQVSISVTLSYQTY